MARQVLGKVAITSKGEYNNATSYLKLDAVSYNGSSYLALQDTVGHLPTDTEYWQLIASKGETGEGIVEGGTTGQVLKKKSNTDFDTEWADDYDDTEIKQDIAELERDIDNLGTEVDNLDLNKVDKTTTINNKALNSNITLTPSDIGIGTVFTLKGSVSTKLDLPQVGNQVGDVYYVEAEEVGYIWLEKTGVLQWEQLGLPIDLSNYALISETGNKVSFSLDNTTNILTLVLKDKNDNTLSTQTVDLTNNVNTLIENDKLNGTTAPTTSTVGYIGQFYLDTATQTEYVCVGISGTPATYTWKKIGGGDYKTYLTTEGYSSSNQFDFGTKEEGIYKIDETAGSNTTFYYKLNLVYGSSGMQVETVYILKKFSDANINDIFAYVKGVATSNGSSATIIFTKISDTSYTQSETSRGTSYKVITSKAQEFSGIKTFSALPQCSVTPTTNNQLVNKLYVDTAIASAITTTLGGDY